MDVEKQSVESFEASINAWPSLFRDLTNGRDVQRLQKVAVETFASAALFGQEFPRAGITMGGILEPGETIRLSLPCYIDAEASTESESDGRKVTFRKRVDGMLAITDTAVLVMEADGGTVVPWRVPLHTVSGLNQLAFKAGMLSLTSAGPGYELLIFDAAAEAEEDRRGRVVFRLPVDVRDKSGFDARLRSALAVPGRRALEEVSSGVSPEPVEAPKPPTQEQTAPRSVVSGALSAPPPVAPPPPALDTFGSSLPPRAEGPSATADVAHNRRPVEPHIASPATVRPKSTHRPSGAVLLIVGLVVVAAIGTGVALLVRSGNAAPTREAQGFLPGQKAGITPQAGATNTPGFSESASPSEFGQTTTQEDVLDDLSGLWTGEVTQEDEGSTEEFSMDLALDPDPSAGTVGQTTYYLDDGRCTGNLYPVTVGSTTAQLDEEITSGPCVKEGTIHLTPDGDDLDFTYNATKRDGTAQTVTGTLTR